MATIEKYQTKSGATLYRVRYRTPDGKRTDKRGFDTRRDAQAFANTVEVSKLTNSFIAPEHGKVTVDGLGPAWLQRQASHMKPSGFRSTESAWRNHVVPRWGSVRIGDIRHTDVGAWIAGLATQHSASTVHRAYGILRRILEDAVHDRLLPSNPARGVKLPRPPARRNVYLAAAQLQALADESGPLGSLVLVLGVGGLRWGEAAALRVCDVDFLRRKIELHRNAVTVGSRIVVGSLKGGKSRTIVLPKFVIEAIAAAAVGKDRDALLWPTVSGAYRRPPGVGDWLDLAVRRCQKDDPTFPRITAHALRHTAASLAIHAGANPKVVQRMLGHASAAMTLDVYADLFESDLDTVAARVGDLWSFTADARREGKG
jgi:integrase